MKGSIASTLAFASLALATPIAFPDKPSGALWWSNKQEVVPYTAKFDDETAGLLGLPVAVPTSLGPYDNLYYQSFSVISLGAVTGLKPQSAPNVITSYVLTEAQGTPRIYTDYDDSITDHFNLQSFYFGCVLASQETDAGVLLPCDLTVTGFRNQKQVASQTVSFAPGLALSANMAKAQLSGFSNVDNVEFAVNGLNQVAAALLIDNVKYDAYLKEGASWSG